MGCQIHQRRRRQEYVDPTSPSSQLVVRALQTSSPGTVVLGGKTLLTEWVL